jgi:hypothetical protein
VVSGVFCGKRVVYGVLDGKIRAPWGGMGSTWEDFGGNEGEDRRGGPGSAGGVSGSASSLLALMRYGL